MEMIKAITTKRAKAQYSHVIPLTAGYGSSLVTFEAPRYYNKGRNGINYTLYDFGRVALSVGACPVGDAAPYADTLVEYESEALATLRDNTMTTAQKRAHLNDVIHAFIGDTLKRYTL